MVRSYNFPAGKDIWSGRGDVEDLQNRRLGPSDRSVRRPGSLGANVAFAYRVTWLGSSYGHMFAALFVGGACGDRLC